MTGAMESVATMLADVRSHPNYNYHGLRLPLVLSTVSPSLQHNEITSQTLDDSALTEMSAYLPFKVLVEHANENDQVKIVFMIY
ncbi:hypothetical protein TYRP_005522 [Tyrophagus putrescentiae]|nr:hypothetical protein TYRP_005522 [Tyrophagus putrescentiae]